MAGGCGAEPRASQYGGATPGGVGTVRTDDNKGGLQNYEEKSGRGQWLSSS